jgi:hypothetical protein
MIKVAKEDVLKLKAADDEDLEVFATMLQDAPMPLAEVTYLEDEKRFAALFHRFCYEHEHDPTWKDGMCQVDCALVFEQVESAEAWDIGGLGGEGSAELMTIVSEGEGQGRTAIMLVFHGGGHIRLEASAIDGRLADIGEPRRSTRVPRHTPSFD